MRNLVLGLALFSFSIIGVSQETTPSLLLRNGTYSVASNVQEFISRPDFESAELVANHYYRLIQFNETPTAAQKSALESAGITLFDYLPKKAFYAAIEADANLNALTQNNARAVLKLENHIILSKALYAKKYPDWAMVSDEQIELTAIHFADISEDAMVATLEAKGAKITMRSNARILSFTCPIADLEEYYSLPGFYYFETVGAPEEPEDYKDVSNHRSNYINNPTGVGTSYSGEGVTVMMQDDGTIGPHIDYQGRITTAVTGNGGDHGDHVAGIIMGAGNLNPDLVGNAPGAHLLVYGSQNSNYNLVPDLYTNGDLVITSKSYGDGQNAGYTSLSMQLDEQCRDYNSLVHVFSAGNSGTSDFGYGAGPFWGNITGGHKQGKNVLAVGNLTFTDALSQSSSRGPADDGRIKPDICAVGSSVNSTVDPNTYDVKSGTSMACPGVAGSLALLYEAYRDLNGGQNPSNALINGAILNTAEDLGNPGPDFQFGWGRINTRRAYQLIEDQNYMFSSVATSQTQTHTIDVPAGIKQLRIMVYWTDYPASPSANPALVNDINMTVTDPVSTVYQPWVLNSTPSAGLLNLDAQPGVDDLNNVEQITIDDPYVGAHTVNITGFDIPQGPQNYVVVYEFVRDEIVITFPIGGESVRAGSAEMIRWDAVGENETFKLEYTLDDGQTWNNINPVVPADWRSFTWNVPGSAVSSKSRVRITRGNETVESKTNFSVIRQPTNLNVEWACQQSFNFSWDSIPGAIGYEVFLLGDKYMDSVGYSTTTNCTVYANSLMPQWFSVRAIGPDNCIGKRAEAVYKNPSISGCTLDPPVADFTSECFKIGPGSCVQFSDISANAGQGAAWEWSFPGGTPSTSNLEKPYVCYDTEGYHTVSLIVKNGVGEDEIIWNNYVHVFKGTALPFTEDFESGLIPAEWVIENENGGVDWMIDNSASAYNIGSSSMVFDNGVAPAGAIGVISTQQLDLSSEDAIMELSFDVAYAQGDIGSDSLKVYITNDCGVNKRLLYSSGGAELATADPQNTLFVPKTSEWKFEAVSLADFKDWTSASFIFENYSSNGNALYVDNINLRVSEENFSPDLISTFPNPFTDELTISGLVPDEETTIRIHSANGELVYENTLIAPGGTMVLDTEYFADGMYIIKITGATKTHKMKLIKGDD